MLMLPAQRHWLVEMLVNFLHWPLLLTFPAFIVLILLRRWRRAALWAIPMIAFMWLFGELFLPPMPTASAAEEAIPLRVMTYNSLGEARTNTALQIETIRDSGADIVALQELSTDTAAAIEAGLADLYPYRALYPYGIPGTGLLSKYPISDPEAFQLTMNHLYHLRATVTVEGVPITVISAHPPPPYIDVPRYTPRGAAEITALLDLAATGTPTLLMGDFNVTDQSADYRLLAASGLHDAHREAGWGFGATWPSRRRGTDQPFPPLIRLDYIFHTDEFRTDSIRVGDWALSDHRPVIAELMFTP